MAKQAQDAGLAIDLSLNLACSGCSSELINLFHKTNCVPNGKKIDTELLKKKVLTLLQDKKVPKNRPGSGTQNWLA